MANQNNFVMINNATITHARFVTPKIRFGKPAWEVSFTLENREAAIAAWNAGVKVKEVDGQYIASIHKDAVGNAQAPIVVGRDLQPIDGKQVGPGSIINIKVRTFDYNYNGKQGKGVRLAAVQAVTPVAPPSNSATAGFVAQ